MINFLKNKSQSTLKLIGLGSGVFVGILLVLIANTVLPSLSTDEVMPSHAATIRTVAASVQDSNNSQRRNDTLVVKRGGSSGSVSTIKRDGVTSNDVMHDDTGADTASEIQDEGSKDLADEMPATTDANDAAATIANSKSYISIVLLGLGLNESQTDLILEQAPKNFTLAFSPYGRDVKNSLEKAQNKGFKTLLEWPMEPETYPLDDPGPLALLTSLPVAENLTRLNDLIKILPNNDSGLITFMGEKFVKDQAMMSELIPTLSGRVSVVVDHMTGAESLLPTVSRINKLDYLRVSRSIDTSLVPEEVSRNLTATVDQARERGHVIVTTFPYPMVMEKIGTWSKTLPDDVELVPVTHNVMSQ